MSKYEPEPRFHHYSVAIGKKCYMYGGCCSHEPSSFVEVFDQVMKTWTKYPLMFKDTLSNLKRWRGACCSLATGDIYMYGGFSGQVLSDQLFILMTKSLEFIKLSPGGDNKPRQVEGCRMVAFHGTKLALYGGQYFLPPRLTITNNFHVYDSLTGDWSVPVMKGINLPPNSYFSFTAIDSHRALVFGGHVNDRTNSRTDGLYLIDFNKMEMIKLERKRGQPWPAARGSHAACCLGFESERSQLLIIGGLDSFYVTIGDAWIYDLNSHSWTELTVPEYETVLQRINHSATAIYMNPKLIEVTIFGGCYKFNPYTWDDNQQTLAETTVLKFELRSGGQWILLPVVGTINEVYPEIDFLNTICGMIEGKMKAPYKNMKEVEQVVFSTWAKMPISEKKKTITEYSSQPLEGHCLLTPKEYQALDIVFSAYNSKEIMDAWHLIRHLRVVTLHIITLLLESNRQEAAARDLKSNLEKAIQRVDQHEAYKQALVSKKPLKMTYLKFIAFGLPRSGKSSTFRRLIGEIINLHQLGGVSRSTGVAECRDVIIKPFKSVPAAIVVSNETSSRWESLNSKLTDGKENPAVLGCSEIDHKYLAHLYFHLISQNVTEITIEDSPSYMKENGHKKNEAKDTIAPQKPEAFVPTPVQSHSPEELLNSLISHYIGVECTVS